MNLRRLLCLGLPACLLLTLAGAAAAPEASAALPVFDAANFRQAVIDHLKRLFEVAQRAVMIANQIQELDYWFYTLLSLEQIPYREGVLEFLQLQGELLREFEELKGQYQALSHALEDVTEEFDITFPGWRAISDMTAGASLRIRSEAGNYDFDSPLEYARYQSARTLQAVRQTLQAMAEDQAGLLRSQEHLEELKTQAQAVEGHQQALEIQTSFAALSAEQLVALRQSQEALTVTLGALGAHRLNADMEARASQSALARDLEHALLLQFGLLVPEHTGEQGVPPFPSWVVPF